MAFINITLPPTGLVDVNPPIVYINTTDSLSTVTTAGYLNLHANSFDLDNLESGSMCVVSNTTNVVSWLVLTKNGNSQFTLTSSSGGGSGTVTNIQTSNGLTGGPITTTGTISMEGIANNTLLANISGSTTSPSSQTMSSVLDSTIGNTSGSIIYRSTTAWNVLPAGTTGQILSTNGVSAAPAWISSSTGTVTSVATGTGLIGGPITSTGTVSLANIANNELLANISGASASPTPTGLSELIDSTFGAAQGDILYRDSADWAILPAGTAGQVLSTNGPSANPAWSSASSGTVTSVAAGAGLTGGPITASGTISLDLIVNNSLLANTSGVSSAPISTSLSALIDSSFGSAQGDILYRGTTDWTVLTPGTAGQVLQTGGTAANPTWFTTPTILAGNSSVLNGGPNFSFSAAGVTSGSTVVCSIQAQTSTVTLLNFSSGTNSISVTFSDIISGGHVSWISYN